MHPMELVMNMITKKSLGNNPMVNNLIEMAKKGDRQGVETFARNIYAQQGKDFDKEFNQFMSNFK